MSKKITLTLIVAGAFIFLLTALVRSHMNSVTKEGVDKLIRQEVPLGSTKDQIYEFLETRKIQSEAYNAGLDPYVGLPDKERQWKQYIVAWIPENLNPSISEYDITIYFYFDENYTLIDYKLQQLDNVP